MGWNSGGEILNTMAIALHAEYGNTEPSRQTTLLSILIKELEEYDCDVLDESFGITPACDAALVANGYHMPTRECMWNEDWTKCFCGFEPN